MKIRLKGLRNLIKAVQNRAHLFPVKKLINGKTKTFYATRYVSGGEAMDIAKQGYKINPYQEVVFESKDGKRKNISEKEVLQMYDAAGKPGILQEFIKQNFKRPKVKTSTKDNGQLSFDNMMQDSKPTEDAKIKDNKQETQVEDKETQRKERRLNFYREMYSNGSLEIDVENMGNVLDSNGDPAKKESDIRKDLIFQFNNEINYMKNNAPFNDVNSFNTIKKDYERHKVLREALTSKDWIGPLMYRGTDKIEYWQKAAEVGVLDLNQLYDFDNDYKNGKYDKYNATLDYIPRMLCQQGANVWEKHDMKRLYFNAAGDSVADRIASEQNIDKASQDYDALKFYTNSMYLDLNEDKLYIKRDGANNKYLDGSTREKILSYAREKINELGSQKTSNENKPSKDSIMTIEQEKILIRRLNARRMSDNPFIIRPDEGAMMGLTGIRNYNNMNGEPTAPGRANEIRRTLDSIDFDLNTGKATVEGTVDSETLSIAQEAINKLISEIKAETQGNEPNESEKPEEQKTEEPEKEVQKLIFRSAGLSGGLIRYDALRKGTTKVKSKNEYKPIKNINELIEQVKPIKDAHANIKGRAIMDMFGISTDLYSKANNILFPIGPGAAGYCTRQYNEKTGGAYIAEIGLVADRNNPAAETKAAIHECMHAKIGMSGKNKLIETQFSGNQKGKHLQLKIEEPMVELAGQALASQIHGDEARKNLHSYATLISSFLPRVWNSGVFKDARKQGALGIGQEIAKQLTNGNTDFINKVYDSFNSNDDKKANSNRMKAIEIKVLERTDKVEKIQNDTGVSEIANLVEELKRGTISLEGALNSSKYKELAAVLITKFLEDEDMEVLEQLALSF